MTARLGLAIVGLGMASKPHALALSELSDRIDVIGAFARSPDSRATFEKMYGYPTVSDMATLIQDPKVDALLLITPPNARMDIVSAFAKAGKHILCEKPLERTVHAANAIVRTCEEEDVKLGVVFQHRFRSASQKLSELVAADELGPIRVARANIPWWREQAYYNCPGRGNYARDGGGVLISQAIHTLDLMLSLTPPVSTVIAHCTTTPFHTMEAEDLCTAAIEFEGGCIGSVFASTACFPGEAESLTLDCDKASVRLQSGVLTIYWRDGRTEQFGEEAKTGGGADPMAFPFDWHKSLIADFADAIEQDRQPLANGRQTLAVHELIEAIEASSRQGRRIKVNSHTGRSNRSSELPIS